MPIEISCTVKNASALQTRRSHAVARSSAPPMQPPWIAQTTGKRASSSALKQSISLRSDSWKPSRSRGVVAGQREVVAGEHVERHAGREVLAGRRDHQRARRAGVAAARAPRRAPRGRTPASSCSFARAG